MGFLIPVQYGANKYPQGIIPKLREIPAHFDRKYVDANGLFSLHTEFSYGARSFSSPALINNSTIQQANVSGVPQLWYSDEWAMDFAQFVFRICNGRTPEVIEVHPPFYDYSDIGHFLNSFSVFEQEIASQFPDVQLLIENRYGTLNNKPFVISKAEQLVAFSDAIDKSNTCLRITLDLPQLLSAEQINPNKKDKLKDVLRQMRDIRHNIGGIHLWGKKNNSAHVGDLNTLFRGHADVKQLFLEGFKDLLDDNMPRLFVPEVNGSQQDFHSIIADVLDCGIKLC